MYIFRTHEAIALKDKSGEDTGLTVERARSHLSQRIENARQEFEREFHKPFIAVPNYIVGGDSIVCECHYFTPYESTV